tara:strand:+ start:385 stop:537 length:153 start_codon:yes stop_codon:yes gene_type:complete
MIGYIGASVSVFKALIKLALPNPYPYKSNGVTALNYFMTILYHQIDRTYY